MNTSTNLQQLKAKQSADINTLFKTCGVFWAFSDEQFHANKTQLKEGEKYASMGAGGYLPASRAKECADGMERIRKEYNAAVNASKKQRRANIAYELRNHEAYYTNDIEDAMGALGTQYTRKEVAKVYHEELKKELENSNA